MEDKRFIPHLKKDYYAIRSIYEKWQYAERRPTGTDECVDKIIDAMHAIEDVIDRIESNYREEASDFVEM